MAEWEEELVEELAAALGEELVEELAAVLAEELAEELAMAGRFCQVHQGLHPRARRSCPDTRSCLAMPSRPSAS